MYSDRWVKEILPTMIGADIYEKVDALGTVNCSDNFPTVLNFVRIASRLEIG
jgi:hypothetical protein